MPKRNKDLEKFWRETIHRQAMSRLTVKAFCERENLKDHTFFRWQSIINARDEEERAKKRNASRSKTQSSERSRSEDNDSQERKCVRTQREEKYWLEMLDEWAESRLSSQEFANQRGIEHRALWMWMRKLRPNTRGNKLDLEIDDEPEVGFAPATIVDDIEEIKPRAEVPPGRALVEIVLRCGRVIRLNSECSPAFLTAVITAAEEAS